MPDLPHAPDSQPSSLSPADHQALDQKPLDQKTLLSIRADFPLIRELPGAYLDNAATTQKPDAVIDALSHYYRHDNANVHRAAHPLSERATLAFEQARQTVRDFIHAAHIDEIIWTRGTTEAINLVAQSYGQSLNKGDEILVSTLEHHANIVPWQMLCERTGAVLRPIPIHDNGELDLDAYTRLLSSKTALVALTQCSNALGLKPPLKHMIAQAHACDARVLVDGAQATAHEPVNVSELDCDFYVFSGHKMYGPTGIGVLYGKRELLARMPPWQGGGEMIERVSFQGTRYNRPPFRFEAGTPAIAATIGLAAAINYLNRQDRARLQQSEQQLLDYARQELAQLPGFRVIGSAAPNAPIISFVHQQLHSYDIGQWLAQQHISIRTGHHCAMPLMERLGLPEGTARASFALYNSQQDVELFITALQQLQASLTPSVSVAADITPTESRATRAPSAASLEFTLSERLQAAKSWQQRYALLLKAAKAHPPLDSHLRNDRHLLHGCTSKLWLHHHYDTEHQRLTFLIDSDARIILGLALVLLEAIQYLTPQQLLAFDFASHLDRLKLLQHLSASRSNGLHTLIAEIQRIARLYI